MCIQEYCWFVLCWEVVLFSKCPLSEVSLYLHLKSDNQDTFSAAKKCLHLGGPLYSTYITTSLLIYFAGHKFTPRARVGGSKSAGDTVEKGSDTEDSKPLSPHTDQQGGGGVSEELEGERTETSSEQVAEKSVAVT